MWCSSCCSPQSHPPSPMQVPAEHTHIHTNTDTHTSSLLHTITVCFHSSVWSTCIASHHPHPHLTVFYLSLFFPRSPASHRSYYQSQSAVTVQVSLLNNFVKQRNYSTFSLGMEDSGTSFQDIPFSFLLFLSTFTSSHLIFHLLS